MSDQWTEEEVKELIQLNGDGFSRKEIAIKMEKTKNQVIGKMYRLGMVAVLTKERTSHIRKYRRKWFEKIQDLTPLELVKPLNKTLLELDDNSCRWPTNDEGPFTFCGLHKLPGDIQYCAPHARVAYMQPTK